MWFIIITGVENWKTNPSRYKSNIITRLWHSCWKDTKNFSHKHQIHLKWSFSLTRDRTRHWLRYFFSVLPTHTTIPSEKYYSPWKKLSPKISYVKFAINSIPIQISTYKVSLKIHSARFSSAWSASSTRISTKMSPLLRNSCNYSAIR